MQQSLYRLHRTEIYVQFSWVPAHVGIKGNEGAVKTAKIATQMNYIIDMPFGKAEVKAILKKSNKIGKLQRAGRVWSLGGIIVTSG